MLTAYLILLFPRSISFIIIVPITLAPEILWDDIQRSDSKRVNAYWYGGLLRRFYVDWRKDGVMEEVTRGIIVVLRLRSCRAQEDAE